MLKKGILRSATTKAKVVLLALGLIAATLMTSRLSAFANTCPFCSASGQTMRQEMETMDVVALASLVKVSETQTDSLGTFRIEKIIKGELYSKIGATVEATYYGPPESKKMFLIQGVDPKSFVWSAPIALTEEAKDYLGKLLTLSEEPVERLAFYQDYFEHPDFLLSRDAYDEFAQTPYEEVVKLKPRIQRQRLIDWINDPAISVDRKRLYYTLVAICDVKEDAKWMEAKIKSVDEKERKALDALSAAYLSLVGTDGLGVLVENYLKNEDSDYVDVYAVVGALRFHATEGQKIEPLKVADAMSKLLDRPDLADLVIPDLARLEDWRHLDKLMTLFKQAKKPDDWLIRSPVINFMRACPLPEAEAMLAEMEKIDPASVKRAKTHFPIPKAEKPAPKDLSKVRSIREGWSKLSDKHVGVAETDILVGKAYRREQGAQPNQLPSLPQWRKDVRVAYLDHDVRDQSREMDSQIKNESSKSSNHPFGLFVIMVATSLAGLAMWYVGTGGLR
ncbi:MAG: hypothetical protein MUC43_01045 [Pirellula sp.]|jgi:hypothetical protein|nr:hypothetical protein [Pirellula sp.]